MFCFRTQCLQSKLSEKVQLSRKLRHVTQLTAQESKAHGGHSTAANVIPATLVTSPSKTRSRSVSPAKIPGWFCVTVLHVFYSQLISDDIFCQINQGKIVNDTGWTLLWFCLAHLTQIENFENFERSWDDNYYYVHLCTLLSWQMTLIEERIILSLEIIILWKCHMIFI